MAEQKSKLQEAKDKLEKSFGKGTVISGNSKVEVFDVVSTGSFNLDRAIGVGGLPYGKTVEIMGWESSGKSTITLNCIANHQKKDNVRKAVLIDAEHSFDRKYAQKLGVDVDELVISQPDYGEMGFDVANELIASGEVGILVIDSATAMLPKKLMEGEAEDKALGLHARLMSQEVPKLMSKAAKYNCLLIFISQFREKIGVMYGSPVTTNGGNALKFYSHVRLEVSKSVDKEGQGNETKVVVKKNKLAPPFKDAKFFIDWGIGINRDAEILDIAVELKIVNKSGSWFSYEGNKLGQGSDKVLALLADNPELKDEIERKVLSLINEPIKNAEKEPKVPEEDTSEKGAEETEQAGEGLKEVLEDIARGEAITKGN